MRALSVYKQYIRISFNSAAAYRANFFFMVFISMLGNLSAPLLTLLIYAGGSQFPGWTFHEALLIQSVFMLCNGVCAPFFMNMVWITMDYVRNGTYDILLLKPGSTVFITAASSFDLENIGVFAAGSAMFIYSICGLPPVSAGEWLQFAALFIMGISMTLGCILLMTATTFKWVGNSRIFEILDSITRFGRYPGTIFGGVIKNIIIYAIPVSMLGFFPASAILGRTDAGMFAVCVPCALFLIRHRGRQCCRAAGRKRRWEIDHNKDALGRAVPHFRRYRRFRI